MERYINIVDYHQRKNNRHEVFDRKVSERIPTCQYPWKQFVINQQGVTYACRSPAWLPKGIGSLLDYDNFFELLNSYEARSIRSEVSLNRYSFCNHKICSHLSSSIEHLQQSPQDPNDLILLTDDQFTANSLVTELPTEICFDFDYTCNFKCPSCRSEMINFNQGPQWEVNKQLVEKIKHLIIDEYVKSGAPVTFRWAGGEPLVSQAYINLWQYIVDSGAKNIRNVVQTNGSYLIKRSRLLEKLIEYIDIIRISFDAGTADTYSQIRVNGDWDSLLDNVRYIRQLVDKQSTSVELWSDFVIQQGNYNEIPQYVELAKELRFDKIAMGRMWNWDTWDNSEFERLNVSDPSHCEYAQLQEILKPYRDNKRVLIHG